MRTGIGSWNAPAQTEAFTLRGLVVELSERGLKVDYRTVWTFVRREGLSFKKTVLASEQDRPDVARKRARWKAYRDGRECQEFCVRGFGDWLVSSTIIVLRLESDRQTG